MVGHRVVVKNNRIAIPSEILEKYGLEDGDEIEVSFV